MHLRCKTFSCYTLLARDRSRACEREQAQRSYNHSADSTYRMGNEVPLPCADRRHQTQMSRLARANLRRRGRADSQRSGQQRSCPHAHRVSAIKVPLGFGQKVQRANLPIVAAGISGTQKTVLGPPLLGHRIWSMEHGQYHGRGGATVP